VLRHSDPTSLRVKQLCQDALICHQKRELSEGHCSCAGTISARHGRREVTDGVTANVQATVLSMHGRNSSNKHCLILSMQNWQLKS
jgi:hypothetical protein